MSLTHSNPFRELLLDNFQPTVMSIDKWRSRAKVVLSSSRTIPSLPYLWHVWDTHVVKQESVRTTVDIPTSLYRRLKEQAAAQGRSVRELILAGAKSALLEGQRPRPKRVRFPLIVSKGPKVDLTNELIYEYVEFP